MHWSDRKHRIIDRRHIRRAAPFIAAPPAIAVLVAAAVLSPAAGAAADAVASYREKVQPILETYCYNCHGYGANEGGRTLDEFGSDEQIVTIRPLWLAVLKNVRAGVMPPAGEPRPDAEERRILFDWIKYEAFGIDPTNPDPGLVTIRRLNRVEYRNTIRDLMHIDFDTTEEFPADDTGYGFDNIGDVLSLSPLLVEKYMEAAEEIVARAVPQEPPSDDEEALAKFRRFFPRDKAPDDAQWRDAYAREVLTKFARRAYRRPPDDASIERLVALARQTYSLPDQTFEAGISRAMVAVLASPRFLFRVEDTDPATRGDVYPLLDEHSLAARLSYFLWSTMPDDELGDLADRGELRANLNAQLERMVQDKRSRELGENFAGQWLRARDVERFEVDLRFGHDLALAMQRETERYFDHVARNDRSALELIDSNYTFLNERLANHYGIEGVEGDRMRRVELPADSPRGGVLTQGTMLVVTSNPTRTSPVKRGLFILDNVLGTPPPPPPPDVPSLESAAEAIEGRKPTVRELLEQHRRDPLCHSCHARMDPLGLAFENFNKLGKWRDDERGQPIDASGTLLSGEQFSSIKELKTILQTQRRLDFYRCLTEKLLTYALGRGLEYYDEHTVDQIVEKLDREQGRFSVLLTEIVESAPFQRTQRTGALSASP